MAKGNREPRTEAQNLALEIGRTRERPPKAVSTTVSLPPKTRRKLERTAVSTGQSMAAVVTWALEKAIP